MLTDITYTVTYKTDNDIPQHDMTFRAQSAAIAFAFTVEAEGGVAVIVRKERETPFTGRRPLSLED